MRRDCRSDVTSRCGEDGIITKVFEVMGVNSGTGYLIQANSEKFRELQQTYQGIPGPARDAGVRVRPQLPRGLPAHWRRDEESRRVIFRGSGP